MVGNLGFWLRLFGMAIKQLSVDAFLLLLLLFLRLLLYSEESLRRVRALTGCPSEQLVFHQIDLCDGPALRKFLETCPPFHSCIHFAGLKVGRVSRRLLLRCGVVVARCVCSRTCTLFLYWCLSCMELLAG